LKGVESLNVEIPANKEIVREYYKDQIRQRSVKNEPLNENEEAEKLINDLENNNEANQQQKEE
jgi:hypothetical protein